LFAYCLIIIW